MDCNKMPNFKGVRYVDINGTTDTSGNYGVLAPNVGIPLFFVPDTGSYDALATLFISSSTFTTYIHLSDFATGNYLPSKAVKGKVYYIPFD